jgi:hypothetical protein
MFGLRHGKNRPFQHGWNVACIKSLVSAQVSACLDYVMVKIVSFSMSKFSSWSKLSVSACLECVMVKIVSFSMSALCHGQIVGFSMAGMCHGPNGQFQHSWNVSWSKLSVSA